MKQATAFFAVKSSKYGGKWKYITLHDITDVCESMYVKVYERGGGGQTEMHLDLISVSH